jgi:hypothetical protein
MDLHVLLGGLVEQVLHDLGALLVEQRVADRHVAADLLSITYHYEFWSTGDEFVKKMFQNVREKIKEKMKEKKKCPGGVV